MLRNAERDAEILRRYHGGESRKIIAAVFGISYSQVTHIINKSEDADPPKTTRQLRREYYIKTLRGEK